MATAANQEHSIKGDRALASGDEDKLGFRDVAKRIAISLVDRASEDGLVVGIEGAWGSGKSSLMFLIGEELKRLPQSKRPTVIDFRPWLVGNRDALITSLFGELAKELEKVALSAGDATPTYKANAKKAGEALRSFMRGISTTGSAIEVLGEASGWGPAKWAGKGLKALDQMVQNKPKAPSLSDLKDNLVTSLRDLGHRFIVTIDDVDRLEPAEVIEILRLVRSVVDLPNVIYVLCYDIDILAHSIEQASRVVSGKDYLEKIVQLTVMVPKPEPLQLRQWFTDDLQLIAAPKNEDELARLKSVIDYEGGRQLKTPRSVVRALDAIRFFWPPLQKEEGDLADLVWLQLIKDGNPKLYRWIEEYCATCAAVSVGIARVEAAEKTKTLQALEAAVPEGHFADLMYRYHFAEQLPAVETDHSEDVSSFQVFQPVEEDERDAAIKNRRLASPDHYRLYFALAGPSHALSQHDYLSMWSASGQGVEETNGALLALHREPLAGSLTKADMFLERLTAGGYESLSEDQSTTLLLSFSQVMDAAFDQNPFEHFSVSSIWDRARQALPPMLSKLGDERKRAVIDSMFGEGGAIGWLTSVLRRETFAHGRYGDRARPEKEWILSDANLDLASQKMLQRYREMSLSDVFESLDPLDLLFAWRQLGDEAGPKSLVQESLNTDAGFIDVLERLITYRTSSDRGRYAVLKKENVEPFLDFEHARERLIEMEGHSEFGGRAVLLSAALKDADRF